ncbi:MAG TPA: ACT domain-containing protein [Phycisphaerae bacterium]|jgi:hypothetical protein
MPYDISKVDVWAAEMEDRPGALGEKLRALADAGVNLEFVIARRQPDKPGTSVVFVAPLKGAAATRAAGAAGFARAAALHALRIEGPDRPGLGATMTEAVGDAGINLRGVSAAALGRNSITYLGIDSPDDVKPAQAAVKKALAEKAGPARRTASPTRAR